MLHKFVCLISSGPTCFHTNVSTTIRLQSRIRALIRRVSAHFLTCVTFNIWHHVCHLIFHWCNRTDVPHHNFLTYEPFSVCNFLTYKDVSVCQFLGVHRIQIWIRLQPDIRLIQQLGYGDPISGSNVAGSGFDPDPAGTEVGSGMLTRFGFYIKWSVQVTTQKSNESFFLMNQKVTHNLTTYSQFR